MAKVFFILLDSFPFFLYFLTSLIKCMPWLKFFYRQKAAEDAVGVCSGKGSSGPAGWWWSPRHCSILSLSLGPPGRDLRLMTTLLWITVIWALGPSSPGRGPRFPERGDVLPLARPSRLLSMCCVCTFSKQWPQAQNPLLILCFTVSTRILARLSLLLCGAHLWMCPSSDFCF